MDYKEYKAMIKDEDNSLEHYGVLGMHWGHHKAEYKSRVEASKQQWKSDSRKISKKLQREADNYEIKNKKLMTSDNPNDRDKYNKGFDKLLSPYEKQYSEVKTAHKDRVKLAKNELNQVDPQGVKGLLLIASPYIQSYLTNKRDSYITKSNKDIQTLEPYKNTGITSKSGKLMLSAQDVRDVTKGLIETQNKYIAKYNSKIG